MIATTGALASRRTRTRSPFARRVRTTDSGGVTTAGSPAAGKGGSAGAGGGGEGAEEHEAEPERARAVAQHVPELRRLHRLGGVEVIAQLVQRMDGRQEPPHLPQPPPP